MSAVGRVALVAGIGLFVVGACSPAETTTAPTSTPPAAAVQPEATTANQIKPETIVTFPKGQIACLTEEALQSALEDGLSGRATKMNRHFEDDGGCLMLDPATPYKVIDAHYRSAELPDAAVLEIVGEKVTAAEQGAFVLIFDRSFVNIVKEPGAH